MIKEPHLKVHYRMRIPTIRSWIVQVTPKDLIIKYHTEGSACRIENVRLDRLKSGLNMDKIEDDIEKDREGRLTLFHAGGTVIWNKLVFRVTVYILLLDL